MPHLQSEQFFGGFKTKNLAGIAIDPFFDPPDVPAAIVADFAAFESEPTQDAVDRGHRAEKNRLTR